MERKKATYTGVCEFCGAQKYTEAKSQKQANTDVSFDCACADGREWREEERKRRKREEVLSDVKKQTSKLKKLLLSNYNIEFPDETAENILQSSAKVFDREFETASIRRGNATIKIAKGTKSEIVLDVKITLAARFEIG